jgi:hypothetical protein
MQPRRHPDLGWPPPPAGQTIHTAIGRATQFPTGPLMSFGPFVRFDLTFVSNIQIHFKLQ